jgi:hypothetical protein
MLHGGTACPTRTAEKVAHGTQRCSSNSWFPLRGTCPRRSQSQRAVAWACLARCWLTSPAASLARPLSMSRYDHGSRAGQGDSHQSARRQPATALRPAIPCGIQQRCRLQQGSMSFAAGRFSKRNSSVPSMRRGKSMNDTRKIRRCVFEPILLRDTYQHDGEWRLFSR